MIVLCHGVFDLLHSGHVEHLRQAHAFGDRLFVSVVPDKYVQKPQLINDEGTRLKMLSALRYVDLALLCNGPGPENLILALRPDVYVRSSEYKSMNEPEFELLTRLSIPCRFTQPVPPHTSDLIARIKAL